MIILGINGIRCYRNAMWHTLLPALEARYSDASSVVEEDSGMDWHQLRRQRRFIDALVTRYDQATQDLLLVGHSLGGVFATAVALRLTKSRVRGVVTICAPNSNAWGYSLIHGAHRHVPAPIVSVSAICDRAVWFGTRHRQSQDHLNVDSDHYWRFVGNTSLADNIAEFVAKHIK